MKSLKQEEPSSTGMWVIVRNYYLLKEKTLVFFNIMSWRVEKVQDRVYLLPLYICRVQWRPPTSRRGGTGFSTLGRSQLSRRRESTECPFKSPTLQETLWDTHVMRRRRRGDGKEDRGEWRVFFLGPKKKWSKVDY